MLLHFFAVAYGGESVKVGDKEDALGVFLMGDVLAHCAEVISDVRFAAGLDAREDGFHNVIGSMSILNVVLIISSFNSLARISLMVLSVVLFFMRMLKRYWPRNFGMKEG